MEDEPAAADTAAFAWAGGPVGCLLVHGFTGTPYEMRYLGETLHRRGHTVLGVRLPGHATHGPELLRSGWRDWYGAASAGVDELRRSCDRVVAIGLSMGALLCLRMAACRDDLDGIALLAPAIEIADSRPRRYAPFVRRALALLPRRAQLLRKNGSDIADEAARAAHPCFPIPLRGMVELVALQDVVRSLLPQVRLPVLLLHGGLDKTCPLENLEVIKRAIGSRLVRQRIFERSAHVLTVDAERGAVADEVAAFVAEASGARAAAG